MLRVDIAQKVILKRIKPKGQEEVDILSSSGRVLAQDVRAKGDLPPFDNSAMDGYAVKAEDTRGASPQNVKVLKVIQDLSAGYATSRTVKRGQAVRIMTGAPIPKGADSVVMVEDTKKIPTTLHGGSTTNCGGKNRAKELIEVYKQVKLKENIRKEGEDVKKGEPVLSRGMLIRPQELAMLAAMGISRVKVTKRPKVAILATGDELVDVNGRLTKGKIRNSNSYGLYGQVLAVGAVPLDFGIAKDNKREIRGKINRALSSGADMLLVSGGVSVGDYDLVKGILKELGTKMVFWRVAIRPGKPLAFGIIPAPGGKGIPVFGLPGNPVSSMVVFEQFVRPAIFKMVGARNLWRPVCRAMFKERLKKKQGLRYFVRVKLTNKDGEFFASLTGPQGSGILKSMVAADGIMVLPETLENVAPGDRVDVQLIS